ncbi:D-glycero-beta-D-manno-heptose-7-phosphate kinase [Candidatus Finniella inopinata]|uniref:Bifunctional protein HldE n=1 Tax=Candidatus Finniella inopinata TaxID=1696036 RepID=A0A4Q7DKB6_9PROT|nr:D-glycero-beta-D-manno-heptose-7-phosphate kinase [Candidatus Finniella inopinata]RZI46818.1 D-glycero-beta-D-manno-heptose-7-phosphate kinase [Candidatus Finniella inopinata]
MFLQSPLKFSGSTVLCIGDVMLDHFIYGQVDRISPESPIPVLRQQHQFSMLGGAGNVMRNMLALGGQVIFISVIGDDATGQTLKNQLKSLTNVQSQLITETNRQTIQKTRFIAQGQQLLRVDEEVVLPCTKASQEQILTAVQQFLPACQAVVLSDYHKGLFTEDLSQILIEHIRLQDPHIPIVVDPKGRHYDRYKGATIITPNLKELSEVAGYSIKSQEGILKESHRLQHDLNIDSVLVTQGAQGMTLVEKEGQSHFFPAQTREVYDVSGAGDTVVAALALGLASGYLLKESCYLANEAAGIAVGKVGTATVSSEELENSLNQHHGGSYKQKIVDVHQAHDLLKRWRHQGLKIGFTNGCFDLLHLGHLHILRQSAQACDKLVLGLNTDASIKRLKGEQRPIQNQQTRAMVLAALGMVDAVILFDEDTPLELIKALQPDVLVKGADYTVDRVVGADLVQARGGRVLLVDLQEGHSTTNTVAKMKLAG